MKRIELMRTTPVVYREGNKVEITGRARDLFRLLILQNGSTVDRNVIASLHAKESANRGGLARTRIRDLRTQLGDANDDLIHVIRASGYAARIEDWEVDSRSFEKTVNNLRASYEELLVRPLPSAQANREIQLLIEAINRWEVNPAHGLYDAGCDDGLQLQARFDDLKRKANDRLIMSRLYSGNNLEMETALEALQTKRRTDPDHAVWKLLLYAQNALGRPIASTIREIENHYQGNVPADLDELRREMTSKGGLKNNPFRAGQRIVYPEPPSGTATSLANATPVHDISESTTLIGLCKSLGISTYSNLRLPDSHLAPLSCIRKTRAHLDFAGVLASKWVAEPHVRAELDDLLHRLDRENGAVRFLIINPNGSAFKRLSILRNFELSKESLVHLKDLIERHKSFSVRVIDSLPSFRIVAIDDNVMSFSPYRLAADAYLAGGRGLDTPYVMLNPSAEYPLAEAFRLLFEENWKSAEPLQDLP